MKEAVAIFVIAVTVYANTLVNGFVFDDVPQIVDNDWITGVRHLPEVFSSGVWDFEGRQSNYYRPLMYVFYMATWYVVGRSPWGYHLLNVLLHAITSVGVFLLVARIVRERPPPAPTGWLSPAFVAGVVFAVHPIHTEPVAWVAGIADVGMTLFSVGSMVLYIESDSRRPVMMPLAAVAFFLALLCKETAIAVPLLLVLYELVLRRERPPLVRVVWRFVPLAAAGALYAALRIHALGGLAPTVSGVPLGPGRYALAVLGLLGGYLEKLVIPRELNFWIVFTPPVSVLSAPALRAAVITLAALAVAWLAGRRSRKALFGVGLIALPLLPAFHLGALNQGIENALTERYLYFPSVGLVLLLALGADWLRRRAEGHATAPALVLGLVTLALAVTTVQRNVVWKDSLSLWSDAARKSPDSAVARMNHGAALLYANRSREGERELRVAATMDPTLVERELRRGAAYAERGLTKKAIISFHTALALDPRSAPAHFALGLTYERNRWLDAAIGEYAMAIAADPAHAAAHNNLGILYAERGLLDRARFHFEAAVRLRPDDADYRSNLQRAEGALTTRP